MLNSAVRALHECHDGLIIRRRLHTDYRSDQRRSSTAPVNNGRLSRRPFANDAGRPMMTPSPKLFATTRPSRRGGSRTSAISRARLSTEADWRLFTTLIPLRWAVYYVPFQMQTCAASSTNPNLSKLSARPLSNARWSPATVNMDHIKTHYYTATHRHLKTRPRDHPARGRCSTSHRAA